MNQTEYKFDHCKIEKTIFAENAEIKEVYINSQPPADPERRIMLILLHEIKRRWIDNVLKNSLHNELLLQLGKETSTDAVNDRWDMIVERPNQLAEDLPSDKKIVDIFDEGNSSLLILGAPGSGKTITLLELTKELVSRAESDPTQPIPVIFNLSSWKKEQSFTEWLVVELYEKYGINKNKGRTWLKNYWLLPLLDGLDEIKPEDQATCVEILNQFSDEHGLAGLVVCSRYEEYLRLPNHLKVNRAICLQPLTLEQIDSYLEKAGSKLDALRTVIQSNTDFQEIAKTPLMLNVMSIVYQDVSPEKLMSTQFETPDAHRKYLFDAYIARMFKVDRIFAHTARQNKEVPYQQDKTIKWLSWLAQKMGQHYQSEFLIEKMQPSWLSTSSQQRLYVTLFWLNFQLLVVLIAELVAIATLGWEPATLLAGLIIGLFVCFFSTISILTNENTKKIEPVEILTWNRAKLKENFFKTRKIHKFTISNFVILPIIGLVAALVAENLAIGGIMMLFIVLMGGFNFVEIKDRVYPNQGIKNSAKNALISGSLTSIPLVLFIGLFLKLELDQMLVVGLFGILLLGLGLFGGNAVIKHYILRFTLYLNGYIPWNLVRFLDYAADRVFLQKRGGSYAFIHKLLQEHFAAMETNRLKK